MSLKVKELRLHQVVVSSFSTWFYIELVTEAGLTGLGECSDAGLYDQMPAEVIAAERLLVGMDLTAEWEDVSARLWDRSKQTDELPLRFMRGTVAGAITTALTDVLAQSSNVPMWEWLGCQLPPPISLYANINRAAGDRKPADFARLASTAVHDGFRAIKLAPFDGPRLPGCSVLETGLRHVEAVRSATGDGVNVYVDVHHRLELDQLKKAIKPLEELSVDWLEDAVDVRVPDDLARLAELTDLPLAGGERLVDIESIKAVAASGHLSFMLLDPKYIGGPFRLREAVEELADTPVTFHNPTGPIGTLACAHFSGMCPRTAPLEFAYGENFDRSQGFDAAEGILDGRLHLSNRPGLGLGLRASEPPTDANHQEVSI